MLKSTAHSERKKSWTLQRFFCIHHKKDITGIKKKEDNPADETYFCQITSNGKKIGIVSVVSLIASSQLPNRKK